MERLSRIESSVSGKWWIAPCTCCDRDDLISLAEAARRLGVAEPALRWALDQGFFPCAARRRGRPAFCRVEVQAFSIRPDLVDRLMGPALPSIP